MHDAQPGGPFLAACDLDRTLIYSKNALWLEGADKDAPALVVAELYGGAPLSYMTRAAEALLISLAAAAAFVPVTTRTQAQYERVQLPGPVPEYAITSNGGSCSSWTMRRSSCCRRSGCTATT